MSGTWITNSNVNFIEQQDDQIISKRATAHGYTVNVHNKLDIDRDVCLYTSRRCFSPLLTVTDLPNVLVSLILDYCAHYQEEDKPIYHYPYFLDYVLPNVLEELKNFRTRILGMNYFQDKKSLALKHVLTLEIQAKQNIIPPPMVLVITSSPREWQNFFALGREYYPWLERDYEKPVSPDRIERWGFVGDQKGESNISLDEVKAHTWDAVFCETLGGDFREALFQPFLKTLQEAKRVIVFDHLGWDQIRQEYFTPEVEPILQEGENLVTILGVTKEFMEVRTRNVLPLGDQQ